MKAEAEDKLCRGKYRQLRMKVGENPPARHSSAYGINRQDQRHRAFRLSQGYARSHCGRTSATPHRRVASLELPAVKLKPKCPSDTAYRSRRLRELIRPVPAARPQTPVGATNAFPRGRFRRSSRQTHATWGNVSSCISYPCPNTNSLKPGSVATRPIV